MRKLLLFISIVVIGIFVATPSFAQSTLDLLKGRLIKSPESSAVYWVGPDQMRHAFPNAKIYFSWYNDFSQVETVTPAELASFPLGRNVLYRPGTRMIKIPSVPEVYAVEPFGVLRNIPSEEVAEKLYGSDWSRKIDDVDISFFFDYTIGGTIEVLDGEPSFPIGSVIEYLEQRYVVDRRSDGLWMLRPVSSSAFIWNQLFRNEVFRPGWQQIPNFYLIGPAVLSPEVRFACVYCDAKEFSKKRIGQSRFRELQGYTVSVPEGFEESFGQISSDFDSPLQVVETDLTHEVDLVQPFAENVLLLRWHKLDFNQNINQLLEERKALADTIYYSGPSFTYEGAHELMISVEDGTVYRHVIFDQGAYFYDAQFTSLEFAIDSYVDIFDVLMGSLTFPQENV